MLAVARTRAFLLLASPTCGASRRLGRSAEQRLTRLALLSTPSIPDALAVLCESSVGCPGLLVHFESGISRSRGQAKELEDGRITHLICVGLTHLLSVLWLSHRHILRDPSAKEISTTNVLKHQRISYDSKLAGTQLDASSGAR